MSSFIKVYHSVTRFCIVFNSQWKRGLIVNFLQPHILQSKNSVRLFNRNVAHSVVLDHKAVSILSKNTAVSESSSSLLWDNMKVKGKKHKDDSRAGTKKKALKCKGKKIVCKSKVKSAQTMATVQSFIQQDGSSNSSDDDVVIIFETPRISKKMRQRQCQDIVNGDSSSVSSFERVSVKDIPLPPERKETPDVSSIPLPCENQCVLRGATTRAQADSRSVLNVLDQRGGNTETDFEELFTGRGDDSDDDMINLYDYENEVKHETLRLQDIRKWENTHAGNLLEYSGEESGETVFTVMSYNVLAQGLLENHRSLYRFHDVRALTWEHRSRTLMNEFRAASADEVNCHSASPSGELYLIL